MTSVAALLAAAADASSDVRGAIEASLIQLAAASADAVLAPAIELLGATYANSYVPGVLDFAYRPPPLGIKPSAQVWSEIACAPPPSPLAPLQAYSTSPLGKSPTAS